MTLKSISEATAELSALIDAVGQGEEVLISKDGVAVAKLVRSRALRQGAYRVP